MLDLLGSPENYDSNTKLVKQEDGNYVERRDDNMSQNSKKNNRTNMGSVVSQGDESWQCSSSCSLETSKCQSIADLYEDPNALFLARILEDKLTDQFAKRHGKIADMAEEIFDL